jgi:hypothetical protein
MVASPISTKITARFSTLGLGIDSFGNGEEYHGLILTNPK